MENVNHSLWSIEEAGVFLKKSVRWIQYAMTKPADDPGSIPYIKIGKKPVFFPDALAEWVARGCPPAVAVKARAIADRRA
jgi:hypothetical protein